MHHLEPLSWSTGRDLVPFVDRPPRTSPSRREPTRVRSAIRGDAEPTRSGFALQAIFRLVLAFRRAATPPVAPARLASIAGAVLELARLEFALLDREPAGDAQADAERDGCLAALEALVGALSRQRPPAPIDLVHAMDTLIVLLVRIDARRDRLG